MTRPALVLLLLAAGSPASAQTAEALREARELLNKLSPPKPDSFCGVQQRPAPQPPPGGQPLVEPVNPVNLPVERSVRPAGPTPGGPLKFDRHGDPLPPGAIARFGTARLRHGSEPLALAFSPDGKWLGSLSVSEGGLRIWDTATGKEVARVSTPVSCAAFARRK